VIPVVAVQVAPGDAPIDLERGMLRACSAALPSARCVRAGESAGAPSSAIAMVSWAGELRARVEVGVRQADPPVWRTRELAFEPGDPAMERWRAIGFTIALLAGDEAATRDEPPSPVPPGAPPRARAPASLAVEARALTGAGLVADAWRLGGELRVSWLLSPLIFVTTGFQYALASPDADVDVRWFDASVGLGLWDAALFDAVEGRLRAELLLENFAVTARREGLSERRDVWLPGVLVGADFGWRLGPRWVLSAHVDAFGLDGSTTVTTGGERVAVNASLGVLLGAGVGVRF
jgi:hypothetical protein